MTSDEAREALDAANRALALAAELIRPHLPILDQFEKDSRRIETFGAILDPTLYRDPERRRAADLLGPCYLGARGFLAAMDRARTKAADWARERGDPLPEGFEAMEPAA